MIHYLSNDMQFLSNLLLLKISLFYIFKSLSCSHPCTNVTISHKKLTNANTINTTILTLSHSNMFQPSKGHIQAVQQIHFTSKGNKISYKMYNSA